MFVSCFIRGIIISLCASQANASPIRETARAVSLNVALDSATVTGLGDGNVTKFLGIPFAKPPVGDLRFRKPVSISPYTGSILATAYGKSCPQQSPVPTLPDEIPSEFKDTINDLFGVILPQSEDCLTINVVKPATATPTSKLPVVVWIFGGGFQLGGTSMYDGGLIVKRSVDIGQPVIYVSMNYRVSAWGFLGGSQVKAAGVGNLGLRDQREALRWVQKYITAFGGDPTKVTIWGESAGAISASLQMVTNGGNTEGLFRGAFMQSGSPLPVADISKGQGAFDALASQVNCSNSADKLQCLRAAPYSTLKAAIDNSPGIFDYTSLSLTWIPRVDGDFLTENPMESVNQGRVATVPYITGDLDDEGTLFGLSTLNITTDTQFRQWITQTFFPTATSAEVDKVLSLYPSNPSAGSPYDTGGLNAITPQFKRIASFQGDLVFQNLRRFLLSKTASKQKAWSYLSKELKGTPILGSFHASDVLNIYGTGELRDYLIRFTANLDPNVGPFDLDLVLPWPQWTVASKSMLLLKDALIFDVATTTDTHREAAMSYLSELSLKYPL